MKNFTYLAIIFCILTQLDYQNLKSEYRLMILDIEKILHLKNNTEEDKKTYNSISNEDHSLNDFESASKKLDTIPFNTLTRIFHDTTFKVDSNGKLDTILVEREIQYIICPL